MTPFIRWTDRSAGGPLTCFHLILWTWTYMTAGTIFTKKVKWKIISSILFWSYHQGKHHTSGLCTSMHEPCMICTFICNLQEWPPRDDKCDAMCDVHEGSTWKLLLWNGSTAQHRLPMCSSVIPRETWATVSMRVAIHDAVSQHRCNQPPTLLIKCNYRWAFRLEVTFLHCYITLRAIEA